MNRSAQDNIGAQTAAMNQAREDALGCQAFQVLARLTQTVFGVSLRSPISAVNVISPVRLPAIPTCDLYLWKEYETCEEVVRYGLSRYLSVRW
jgi:hypothetical protein